MSFAAFHDDSSSQRSPQWRPSHERGGRAQLTRDEWEHQRWDVRVAARQWATGALCGREWAVSSAVARGGLVLHRHPRGALSGLLTLSGPDFHADYYEVGLAALVRTREAAEAGARAPRPGRGVLRLVVRSGRGASGVRNMARPSP